ncbi:RNA-binding signal recognition particle subunit srp14 [Irineochytrium annulatum]|nr:RNA-binding signal recognition particle subunit srp14 [Irineochytrium annulatum]
MLLSREKFLAELSTQFENSKEQGTVYITYKRHSFKTKAERVGLGDAQPDPSTAEYPCIVRSVCGKSKISTLIEAKDTERFQTACGNVLRLHMDNLRKKDKKAKAGKGDKNLVVSKGSGVFKKPKKAA